MTAATNGRRWPDEKKGPWEIVFSYTLLEDGSELCTGISIQWIGPNRAHIRPDELSSSKIRSMRIGSKIAEYRRSAAQSIARKQHIERWARTRRRGEHLASLAPPAEAVDAVRRQLEGRRGKAGRPAVRSADFYAKVAQIYSEAYLRGQNPTQAVAVKIPLSRSGAGKAVYRARKLGLLGPAPGKRTPGGIEPHSSASRSIDRKGTKERK
ncbi:MAG: hypothetical protein M3082_00975 [Candidatus Dormibacteraeota bacterium]|nr:hypothetical protein [Candidatus Dormibacteraeota bacterium]